MTLDDIVPAARDKKVVALFGEVLADIFPDQSVLGGAPFNVARHLQAFGLQATLITRTGADALRDDLLREMHRLGMDDNCVQIDPVYPTGQVQVHIENGQHRFEILPDQAYDHIHAGVTHMMTMALKPDLAYFGTLAQRGMESRLALDKFLEDAKCPRFLDINLRAPWFDKHMVRRSLLRAEIVKLNEGELKTVSEYFKIKANSLEAAATELMTQFNLKKLIITAGESGAWLLDQEHHILKAPPVNLAASIVDTVGAGDAFSAIFIIGLLHQWDPLLSLQRANQFAAALCQVRGGAPSNLDFYLPFKQEWSI